MYHSTRTVRTCRLQHNYPCNYPSVAEANPFHYNTIPDKPLFCIFKNYQTWRWIMGNDSRFWRVRLESQTHFSLCCWSSCWAPPCLLVCMVPFSDDEDAPAADNKCSPDEELLWPPPELSWARFESELLFFLREVNLEIKGKRKKQYWLRRRRKRTLSVNKSGWMVCNWYFPLNSHLRNWRFCQREALSPSKQPLAEF